MSYMIHLPNPLLRAVMSTSAIVLGSLVAGCDKGDNKRVTTVFGKVVDQNKIPIDSIMVELDGLRNLDSEELAFTYTNENGEYEIVLDIPDRYISTNVLIPFLPIRNPKFQTKYKLGNVFLNGQRTDNCCLATIGEKVQWDFELDPK